MNTGEAQKTNLIAGIVIFVLVVAGACFGYYWYDNYVLHVYTDDAAIDSNHVSVSAKIMGRVYRLAADEGDKVEAGQLLVELDKTDLKAQEAQSVAAINTARENLILAKVNISKAQADFNRTKRLFDEGLISKEQFDHAANALEAANAQSAIVQSQIDSAKAQLGVIETQLANTRIFAPISGVIAKRAVLPGEVVQPGQAIFTVNDLKHIWVTANFEETKIRLVHTGQTAEIFVDAYPYRVFKGRVVQVGADIVPPPLSIGDSTKTTQKIPVKILFDRPSDLKLFVPGMSVEVKIGVKQR